MNYKISPRSEGKIMIQNKTMHLVILAFVAAITPGIAHATNTGDSLQDLGDPLNAKSLNQLAGGSGLISNNSQATVNSIITGNQIGNVGSTGSIVGNSLVGDSGLSTLISNSGNQVSISQATVVNVFLH